MDNNEKKWQDILFRDENGKLDFKESYGFMLDKPEDIDTKEWKKYTDGQWDEFAKDVIALSNGDLSSENTSALIVLGVGEKEGQRYIKGIRDLKIDRETIIKKLNTSCSTKINDVIIHTPHEVEGICILEFPFSSYILESKKAFKTYSIKMENGKKVACEKMQYSEHCVFYRSGDTIAIASLREKEILQFNKSRTGEFITEQIISEAKRNLDLLLYVNTKGIIISPVYAFKILDDEIEFKAEGKTRITQRQEGMLFAYTLSMSSFIKEYDHRFLDMIHLDYEIRKYIELNHQHSEKLFKTLLSFRKRIAQMENNKSKILDGATRLASIRSNDNIHKTVDSQDVLLCATYLARASDICKIYIAVIKYFEKSYDYLSNLKLTPFYISGIEREMDIENNFTTEEWDRFINYELSREN